MNAAQKTGLSLEAAANAMGWDVSETTAAFAKLREAEARRRDYYTNVDPRPGQLQIDWSLNFYELSKAEGDAYALHVRAVLAGISEAVADEQLYAAWGIRAEEKHEFLRSRAKGRKVPACSATIWVRNATIKMRKWSRLWNVIWVRLWLARGLRWFDCRGATICCSL